ncbi:hypothetical protein CLM71_06980 [Serratia sp. MYb239]|uniref:Uncharacterized protein n=1 Tax=Serratia rhizosphaerae TaxID=2597702 RepID=A0ABX6GIB9_9GAMM|nr:hypothetical protein CLM71_06980 [Serratia sp. MYb239]QHA86006.1 hypothetical protein FO014_02865 [Serratia rhizosphaerae]
MLSKNYRRNSLAQQKTLRGGNRLQPLILVRFVKYLTKISQFHNRILHFSNQAVIKYMQFLLNVQSKKSLIVRRRFLIFAKNCHTWAGNAVLQKTCFESRSHAKSRNAADTKAAVD